ncbi:dihydroorotase [Reticulomyxa filosa]|uniref:Dihydroorotase n=1 Tax=Reticulomyxa filosa TaxID=46433 RepID=X6NBA0_RETFI|nr:dihydroorotase [Reticulomyxa filosa]|eukprot:ETO22597.1 dihydroorotase [Reticulomyxa filosa]
MKTQEILTIRRPDDFHLHLRDGDSLKLLVPHACEQVARAIVMPNLIPAIRTTKEAKDYRNRILANVPKTKSLNPLMTIYLTDSTAPKDIADAKSSGIIYGVKLYPKGATTNSESGVTSIDKVMETLKEMERQGLPLLIHGEVTDSNVDVFDRESVFIKKVLPTITNACPHLKIVLEHISTAVLIIILFCFPLSAHECSKLFIKKK